MILSFLRKCSLEVLVSVLKLVAFSDCVYVIINMKLLEDHPDLLLTVQVLSQG